MQKRSFRLECDPLEFTGIEFDRPNKALAFFWIAETEAPNIILIRIIVLRLRWPPIRMVTAFIDRNEME